MIIVGFYTNEEYEFWSERLKKSVLKRGWPIDLSKLPDQGEYNANVHQKPKLLLDKLRQYAPRPLLYLDVDCEVVGNIAPLELVAHDMAVCFWDQKLLGGTIYLRNNEKIRKLMVRWIQANREFPDVTDQENLQTVLEDKLTVQVLGPEYCWLERPMRPTCPDTVPLIFHYGISRKRWMKGQAQQ